MSGGNFYALNKKLEQYEALRNLPPINGLTDDSETDNIDEQILKSVAAFIPQRIFMFWNYCQYFCNIINYEVDDNEL
ncbi:MAG: hypothetical protein IKB98_00265 [Clostridia bacterium]|nr:hypothetical protein [Clostridia bacterium]